MSCLWQGISECGIPPQTWQKDVHSIQIVASPTSLQDVIVPKEEI